VGLSPPLLLAALLLSGCTMRDGARSNSPPKPSAPPASQETVVPPRFVDITTAAGIRFRHQNSNTPHKYFVETMGSGGAFIDADGDGWQDVLLLNNAPLPGGRVSGRPTTARSRT
jgi:hypothetical protein